MGTVKELGKRGTGIDLEEFTPLPYSPVGLM